MLWAIWRYRSFIYGSIKRQFQLKYQNSILGVAWSVINPLAMILVYTIVFAAVMRTKLPGVGTTFGYSIYLCAGILTWGFFVEIVTMSQSVFLENANLLKKISFPRLCLPLVVAGNAIVNFLLVFGIFTLFLLATGNFPGIVFVSIIPILLLEMVFALSLGVLAGILNVFFRDVGQFIAILLQFWFWLTPIVYPVSIIPAPIRKLLSYNPMSILVESYQRVLVHQLWPEWRLLLPLTVGTLLLSWLTISLFRKRASEMVDEL